MKAKVGKERELETYWSEDRGSSKMVCAWVGIVAENKLI